MRMKKSKWSATYLRALSLLLLIPQIENPWVRSRALQSVEHLVSRMAEKKERTSYLLSFLQDPSFEIQLQAAIMLSRVDNTITNGLPILIVAATDTNQLTQKIRAQIPNKTNPLGLNSIIAGLVRTKQGLAQEALQRVQSSNASPTQASQF